MKTRPLYIAHLKTPNETESFSLSIGGFAVVRQSEVELGVEIPTSVRGLQRVVVNGEVFHRNGLLREVVRIAPVKITETHFEKVDSLIQHGYSVMGACEAVADETGFKSDSFRQQYYKRHASQKRKAV